MSERRRRIRFKDRPETEITIGRKGIQVTMHKRLCLCCGESFFSEGNHNRMCLDCKTGRASGMDNWGR